MNSLASHPHPDDIARLLRDDHDAPADIAEHLAGCAETMSSGREPAAMLHPPKCRRCTFAASPRAAAMSVAVTTPSGTATPAEVPCEEM